MGRAAVRIYHLLGLPGAGLIFMLEGLGVPIPVEIPLVMVGQRMASEMNTYWEIVLLMWFTTMAGNTAGYLVGYYGGHPLAHKLLVWFRVKPELWAKVEGWFQRHGMKVVVATRWINWGFAQNMWLSGITRVPFGRFFAVMAVNDFLWAMAWTWISLQTMGYLGRRSAHFLRHSVIQIGVAAVVIILIGLGVWWMARYVKKPQGEKQS